LLATNQAEFILLFDIIDDPREDERTTYPVNEILFLVIAAVLSGAESWRSIEEYGNKKILLLRQFFPYLNGIPSRYTIMRFMSSLDKRKFEMFLTKWSAELLGSLQNELVAIDGKAPRGARKLDREENSVFLLNAFATRQGVVIGQQAIDTKNNEITAIPMLLDNLDITGATISIDAIGCQKNIAKKIVDKGGNYFLALKANQETLHADVKDFFAKLDDTLANNVDFYESHDKGHGRVETRRCWSTDDIEWLKLGHFGWQDLTSICCVEARRTSWD
jgi:predicted transposase YbfD/YdcC